MKKSWRQHPTKQQLYGHLPPITKTIKVRRTRYAGHCWRSRDELISDVLLWTPSHGRPKAGRPARTTNLEIPYFVPQLFILKMLITHHHHHHLVPAARISLTLSRHFSPSFIASVRSSGLHPVFSHSCCMYVRAGCPAFARPYVGVHRSTSFMSSSLLLQQCPACLVRLTCIVFVMGGRWPYKWCLVGCCHQDLFNIARNILV